MRVLERCIRFIRAVMTSNAVTESGRNARSASTMTYTTQPLGVSIYYTTVTQ